jgi:hypothetical protein
VSRLQQPVPSRQGVVEDRIVGEVAHGKVVDPANRARVRRAGWIDSLDGDAAHKHDFTLQSPTGFADPRRHETFDRRRY